jgi:hypothetical protein
MLLDDPSEYAKNLKIGGQILKINDCDRPDKEAVYFCTVSLETWMLSVVRALVQSSGLKTN